MFDIYDIAIVPLIIGIVQLCKRFGLKPKYAPFIALPVGILIGIVYFENSIKEGVLIGVMFGLSASGLYSSSKNVMEMNDIHE